MRLFDKEDREKIEKSAISDKTGAFPIEDQEGGDLYRPGRQPRTVDTGRSPDGKTYSDEVYEALGGLNSRQPSTSPIPSAGLVTRPESDTRGIDYAPERFLPDSEPMIGGADVPFTESLGAGVRGPYAIQQSDMDPGRRTTKVGPNWMLPGKSGISDVEPLNFAKAAYDLDEDDKKSKVKDADADDEESKDLDEDDKKSKAAPKVVATTNDNDADDRSIHKTEVKKRGEGLFTDVITGPIAGWNGAR